MPVPTPNNPEQKPSQPQTQTPPPITANNQGNQANQAPKPQADGKDTSKEDALKKDPSKDQSKDPSKDPSKSNNEKTDAQRK